MGQAGINWDDLITRTTQVIGSDHAPPRKRAAAFGNRGAAWHNKAEFQRAIADFTAAIEVDPDYARGYLARGTSWLGAGDLDKAVSDLSAAIRLSPGNALAYHTRGLSWQLKG